MRAMYRGDGNRVSRWGHAKLYHCAHGLPWKALYAIGNGNQKQRQGAWEDLVRAFMSCMELERREQSAKDRQ
jgi:hypothetical protein